MTEVMQECQALGCKRAAIKLFEAYVRTREFPAQTREDILLCVEHYADAMKRENVGLRDLATDWTGVDCKNCLRKRAFVEGTKNEPA